MQAKVKWVDNAMFLGESGSGHCVVMDGPEDHGGRNMGVRPRADAVPAVFTKIHLKFLVQGKDLKETQVKRAVELSAEKYCSASIMMEAAGVEVTHSYEMLAE